MNYVILRDCSNKSSAGELRPRAEDARKITKDQKVILNKINGVHRFFERLDALCSSVKEVC